MEAGEVIAGKYRLNQLLGVGGMATVWSATNVYTDREFAVKCLLPNVGSTEEARARFLMEAKVSARVDHPNVIEVIDVGQMEDGALFLVMELLTGLSLEAAVRREQPPMTVYQLCVVMLEVARALAAAHQNGVVHRDLKPTNIFLHRGRDGNVTTKVLDFGVSKFLESDRNHALTMDGTLLGSPMYMSPEQAVGSTSIDGRADIFAFGAILFEALSGHRCYEAPNFNALLVAVATKPPKSIDECAPQMPEPLRALVRDTLVTDRNKRIANFEAIIERLTKVLPALEKDKRRLPPRVHPPDSVRPLRLSPSVPPPEAPSPSKFPPPPPPISSPTLPLAASTSAPTSAAAALAAGIPPRTARAGVYLVAGGALLSIVIVLVAMFVYRDVAPPPAPAHGATSHPATSAPEEHARTDATEASSVDPDTPTVQVDELPVVTPSSTPRTPPPPRAHRPTVKPAPSTEPTAATTTAPGEDAE